MPQSQHTARQVRVLRRRDGDDCWLCGYVIDFTIKDDDDPWHWSRDHFIPRSLGGPSTVENMRLAHKWCNSHRGAGGRAFPSLGLLRSWAEGRTRP
jgi:5-methylcytosine-specific restriction endonuclease McrA